MSWNEQAARARIRALIDDAPTVEVRRFADEYFPQYQRRRQKLMEDGGRTTQPLFDLPKGTAVTVDTVQIYIKITNYDEYRLSEGRETEASHERALRFLHLYYSACDRVTERSPAQRIDFHGSRMHAVVLDRSGTGVTRETLDEAFEFIRDFRSVADEANKALANSNLTARFRIGVDIGRCVAINNGTALEQEPLFLGSAANHAAKLADGDQPGIYLSDRVRAMLSLTPMGELVFSDQLNEDYFQEVSRSRLTTDEGLPRSILTEWQDEIRKSEAMDFTDPRFSFHHKEPPLSDIKFEDLSPSNSIRMALLSTYADISGYTAYIDSCIAAGEIADAVKALFVIRAELQNVFEHDFRGRKVRFIGDCIHGILAEGTKLDTDMRATVESGAKCAGGLHSSFSLCQQELKCVDQLGLNIGMEVGQTPVTRIGIRGIRSVRIASSVATTLSEQMQSDCEERNQSKFGPTAMRHLPAKLRDLFGDDGVATDISYAEVATALSDFSAEPAAPAYVRSHTPARTEPPRAHCTRR